MKIKYGISRAFALLLLALLSACGGGKGSDYVVPTFFGTQQLGASPAATNGNAVATDASGNVYIAGDTGSSLTPNAVSAAGNTDLFFTKYNNAGGKLFVKQLGTTARGGVPATTSVSTIANGVAIDATSGSIYVVGTTDGDLDSNLVAHAGNSDFFLTKYDVTGAKLNTKQLGTLAAADTVGNAVAIDLFGNVYVTGYTHGNLVGGIAVSHGNTDYFITKYNNAGILQYTKQFGTGGTTDTFGNAIAVDPSGNVYITGSTTGNLGGNTISISGNTDFFLSKHDSTGALTTTFQLGSHVVAGAPWETIGNAVAIDASGNVYVAGSTTGKLPTSASQAGTTDFFVAKCNSALSTCPYWQMGAIGDTKAFGIATDASGFVFVTGSTANPSPGPGLDGQTQTGSTDFFLTKYNSAGTKLYTKQRGVQAVATSGNAVVADVSSNVYVTGSTSGGLDGNVLAGSTDAFLTRFKATTGAQN